LAIKWYKYNLPACYHNGKGCAINLDYVLFLFGVVVLCIKRRRVDVVFVVFEHSPDDIYQPALCAFEGLGFGLALAYFAVVVVVEKRVCYLVRFACGVAYLYRQVVKQ